MTGQAVDVEGDTPIEQETQGLCQDCVVILIVMAAVGYGYTEKQKGGTGGRRSPNQPGGRGYQEIYLRHPVQEPSLLQDLELAFDVGGKVKEIFVRLPSGGKR